MIQVMQIKRNVLKTKCIKDSYVLMSDTNLAEFSLLSNFLYSFFHRFLNLL